jgi:hypothetical protein
MQAEAASRARAASAQSRCAAASAAKKHSGCIQAPMSSFRLATQRHAHQTEPHLP